VSKIAVIGTGYVGLTSGACFAHLGHDVVCADVDEAKVASLQRGEVPIFEEGLDALVREGIDAGRLSFVLGAAAAARDCEFAYLCLPTPQGADGQADLSFVEAAVREIAPVLPREAVIVNKSTMPVGSTRFVEQLVGRPDVAVVSNPEFLREGTAVIDFLNPDRVVIGADDQAAGARVGTLYRNLPPGTPVMVIDPASAETIKYASNAFLAAKLSFVNAVAAICEGVGADVHDVVLGMGYDHRIGHDFLKPGPGWGGSCFPKDTRALLHTAEQGGYEFALLQGVIDVNEEQFDRVAEKVADVCGGSLDGVQVAVWGLTFKAGTDDLRESPSLEVIQRMRERGANVTAYDPAVAGDLDGIAVASDPYAACEGAAVLVVLTEWDEFKFLDLEKVATTLAHRRVVDARNILERPVLRRLGFAYRGVGRV
jgi:UDPglucose 6-dehydrogenase